MTETHVHGGINPLPLLAANARTLARHAGKCPVCRYPLLPGERAADLADGRVVHVHCAAQAGDAR